MDWVDRMEMRRKALCLTQAQMAERITVGEAAYSHWVNRRRVPDNLAQFDRIAAACECATGWLLYGALTYSDDPHIARVVHAMERMSAKDKYLTEQLVETVGKRNSSDDDSTGCCAA